MRRILVMLFLCGLAMAFMNLRLRAVSTPAPSISKFNSVVTKKPPVLADARQVVTADGAGKSSWSFVKGADIDSGAASSGMALIADGNGKAAFGALPASHPTFLQAYYAGGDGLPVNTFVVPAGVSAIYVEAWGGGGGGGGSGANATGGSIPAGGGGGGAAGQYTRAVIGVPLGSTCTVSVGAGGIAGTAGLAAGPVIGGVGGSGNASLVAVQGGATLLSSAGGSGGSGGKGSNDYTGGQGGVAATATATGFQLSIGGNSAVLQGEGAGSDSVFGGLTTISGGGQGGRGAVSPGTDGQTGQAGKAGLVIISY